MNGTDGNDFSIERIIAMGLCLPCIMLAGVDLAGDTVPYIKIAWMEIYKHA